MTGTQSTADCGANMFTDGTDVNDSGSAGTEEANDAAALRAAQVAEAQQATAE